MQRVLASVLAVAALGACSASPGDDHGYGDGFGTPDNPVPADDSRPAYAELDHLTGDLPATERAAVVLRYGYDLDYADIATALGSSEDAARQAASSGVRRLRRRMT